MGNTPFQYAAKRIVITGSSSGIGRACAQALSRSGAELLLMGRNPERLAETLSLCPEKKHATLCLDLTQYAAIEPALSGWLLAHGPVDGFIHGAGMVMTVPIQAMKPAQYESLFAINAVAGFEVARILSRKGHYNAAGASFVFVSSVMGILGREATSGYSSSKGALIAGARSMALELAPKKIRVNCLLPAVVETEMSRKMFETLPEESRSAILRMHPLGFGTPDDIAYACQYLLSDEARWVTGACLPIDGGYSAH
jgi:NAD(P)-dependent dehydrogenase (short-subunit alcohol dehydrogenase family)